MPRDTMLKNQADLSSLERDFASLYGNPSPESVIFMQNSYAALLSELRETRRRNVELERRAQH